MTNISFTGINQFANSKFLRNTVSTLADDSKLLPVALLEGSVIIGRSLQAKHRDELRKTDLIEKYGEEKGNKLFAYDELTETLVKEVAAAVAWLGGVKAMNWIADKGFQKMGIDTTTGWKQIDRMADGRLAKGFKNKLIAAKAAKLGVSIATTVWFVGNVLPVIKQTITANNINKRKEALKADQNKPPQEGIPFTYAQNAANKAQASSAPAALSLNDSLDAVDTSLGSNFKASDIQKFTPAATNKTLSFTANKLHKAQSAKEPSFTGGMELLSKAGYMLENETIPQLLVVDTNLTTSRVRKARNVDEKVEIGFEDGVSLGFYFAGIPAVGKALSMAFDEKLHINSALDPKVLDDVTDQIKNAVVEVGKKNGGNVSIKQLEEILKGVEDSKAVDTIKEALGQKGIQLGRDEVKNVLSGCLDDVARQVADPNALKTLIDAHPERAALTSMIKSATTQAAINQNKNIYAAFRPVANYMDDLLQMSAGSPKHIKRAEKAVRNVTQILYEKAQKGEVLTEKNISRIESILDRTKNTLKAEMTPQLSAMMDDIGRVVKEKAVITKDILDDIGNGAIHQTPEFVGKMLEAFEPEALVNQKDMVNPRKVNGLKQQVSLFAERLFNGLTSKENPAFKTADVKNLSSGALDPKQNPAFKSITMSVDDAVTLIDKLKTKNFLAKGAYVLAGLGVSALFLGKVIPAAKQHITFLRTGSHKSPGFANLLDDIDTPKIAPPPSKLANQDSKTNFSQHVHKPTSISNSFDQFLNEVSTKSKHA